MTTYLHKLQVFDDFTSVSGWSESANLATAGYGVSRNTTSTYLKTGTSSMKLYFDHDAGTVGSANKTYSSTTDFTPYDAFWVNLYIDDINDLSATTDQALRMNIGNDSSNSFTYYKDKTELKTGWNLVKWTLDTVNATTGAPDLKTVDYIRIVSYDGAVSDYSLYVDSIWLIKSYTFSPGLSSLTRKSSYGITSHNIPYRSSPIHQKTGGGDVTWNLSSILIDDQSGNVSYNTERDKFLDASQLDDLLGSTCILETGETSPSIEFRDCAGTEDTEFDMNDDDDEIRKFIYVPTTRNLKSAKVYMYLKETGTGTLDTTITVNDVVHNSVFTSADIAAYAWVSSSIAPEILVEGYNEILLSEGTDTNDGSDFFTIGIDTDNDYGRSQISDEGGTYADETGEYMIYLECTFEDCNPHSTTPKQVIVSNVNRNYVAGSPNNFPYSMTLIEDKI